MEKKITLNDILKESFEKKLFTKKDKFYGLLELNESEAELLKKKHSTKKHTNWVTKQNNRFKVYCGKKRKVVK